MTSAEAVLQHVNQHTDSAWRLDARFAGGMLQGAWRITRGTTVAVLKWHASDSTAPDNPDAAAIVEHLRAAGYPTPKWLASGRTDDGVAWSVQEFAEGEPLHELDRASAELFIELVRLQRQISLPTETSWNPYIRAHVFGGHAAHRSLITAGRGLQALLDETLALAAPFESTELVDDEMVHSDLNVSNVIVRDCRVAAVVDVDGAGRGCAAYDLLSPAVNGVSWASDPAAITRLVDVALDLYGPGPVAVCAACLVIENANWYRRADPAGIRQRVGRYRRWLGDLRTQLTLA